MNAPRDAIRGPNDFGRLVEISRCYYHAEALARAHLQKGDLGSASATLRYFGSLYRRHLEG